MNENIKCRIFKNNYFHLYLIHTTLLDGDSFVKNVDDIDHRLS